MNILYSVYCIVYTCDSEHTEHYIFNIFEWTNQKSKIWDWKTKLLFWIHRATCHKNIVSRITCCFQFFFFKAFILFYLIFALKIGFSISCTFSSFHWISIIIALFWINSIRICREPDFLYFYAQLATQAKTKLFQWWWWQCEIVSIFYISFKQKRKNEMIN